MLKRLLTIVLCVCLVVAFSACSEEETATSKVSSNAAKVDSIVEVPENSTAASVDDASFASSTQSESDASSRTNSKPSVSSHNTVSSKTDMSVESKNTPFSPVEDASAPQNSGVRLRAKNTSGKVGDTVTVLFELSADSNIAAANITVSYDSSMLEFVDYESGEICAGMMALGNRNEVGSFKYAVTGLKSITVGGTFFSIDFKLLKAGKSKVTLTADTAVDENLKNIKIVVLPATVTAK